MRLGRNIRLGRFVAAFPEVPRRDCAFTGCRANCRVVAGCLLVMGIAKGEDGRNDEAVKLCLEAEALF